MIKTNRIKRAKIVIFVSFSILLLLVSTNLNTNQINKKESLEINSFETSNTSLKIVATLTIIEQVVEHIIGVHPDVRINKSK